MTAFWLALVVATTIAGSVLAIIRRRAYKRGFFERRSQTTRPRRERRTTIAGPTVVIATMAGVAASLEQGSSEHAILLAGAILLLPAWWTERNKAPRWVVVVSRVAAALVVSTVGVRAEATGVPTTDVIITTAVVLIVSAAFAALDRVDGTGAFIGAAAAGGVAAIALATNQTDIAAAAAALLGACVGVLLYSLPPANATLGRTGGAFVGLAIAVVGIEMHVPQDPGRALLAPALTVALPVFGAAICFIAAQRHRGERAAQLDERLERRGLSPMAVVAVLGGAQIALSTLAYVDADHLVGWRVTALIGAAIVLLVLLIALSAHPYETTSGFDKRVLAGAAVLLVVAGGAAAFGARQLLSARRHLEAGRDSAQAGLDAARAGDVDAARTRFASADIEFRAARSKLSSPVVSAGLIVPVLAQNITAVRTVTDVGIDLSNSGERVAARAGSNNLRIRDGRFPVAEARQIATDLQGALATLERSQNQLAHIDPEYLSTTVSDAVDTLNSKITAASVDVANATRAMTLAPAMFGGDGPRHYFLAILTPSELRGSGGIIGTYGRLDIDDGHVRLDELEQIVELNLRTDPVKQRVALPAIFYDRYGGFLPDRFWQNLSAPADFGDAAQGIEAAYPLTDGGMPIDGVVAIDPIGLVALLHITGPVVVADWPDPIGPDNAEQILLLDQYVQLSGDVRDRFLHDVARAVFDKLTTGELPAPTKLVDAMSDAVAFGHIKLHSTHADERTLFRDLNLDGALPPLGADSFQLVTQNGSASKIDYFLHRSVQYDVTVDTNTGNATATALITIHNDAPSTGLPNYVLGGPPAPVEPGVNRIYVSFYTPFLLDDATVDGSPADLNSGIESGRNVYTLLTDIGPGTSTTFQLRLHGRVAAGVTYLLNIGRQPVINPDQVAVSVKTTTGGQFTVISPVSADALEADLRQRLTLVLRAPA
ncbi:MAG: hypothetical protein QOI95_325 [Acidimicrobiaceae bacterium]